MIIRIKRKSIETALVLILAISIITSTLVGVSLTTDYAIGATNVTNNTVISKVNVTNTEPNITSVTVDDDNTIPANQIDLVPQNSIVVTCNGTVVDYNGWQDINPNGTNATFFVQSYLVNSAPDNNTLYVNESCGSCRQATTDEATAAGKEVSMLAKCDCKLAVQYYANASSNWVCNMSVRDRGGTQKNSAGMFNLTDSAVSETTTITKLLAINTSGMIDYGNLSVTQTSPEIVFNVTNAGNINLNLTLRGYGGTNETVGENLSLQCDFGNISSGNQRYSLGGDLIGVTSFDIMTNLTNSTRRTNFTIYTKTNDAPLAYDNVNATIWRLKIPLGVGGICNGTIIFGAIEASQ